MAARLRLYFCMCVLCTSLLALSLPLRADVMTLEQILNIILASHPEIEGAKKDADAARYHEKSVWMDDPEVGIEFEEIPTDYPHLKNRDMITYRLSQTIPFPTKLTNEARVRNEARAAKETVLTRTEQAVAEDVKKTVYAWIATQKQLDAMTTISASYQTLSKLLEHRYSNETPMNRERTQADDMSRLNNADLPENGTPVSASDLFMINMKKAEIETVIHDLHHQEAALTSKLNLMMGRAQENPLKITPPPMKALTLDLETLTRKVHEQNTDLKILTHLKKQAEAETRREKQSYFPDLMPEFRYHDRQSQDNAYSVGLGLSLPIWRNRISATVKAAEASAYKAQADYAAQKLRAETDLAYLYNHAKWHHQALTIFSTRVLPLARAATNSGLSEYALNRREASELIQTLTAYSEATTEYWQMWNDYMSEYALLETLIGESL